MPKRSLRRNRNTLLAAFIIALALLVLFATPLFSVIKSFTRTVMLVPARTVSFVGGHFASKSRLANENRALRKKIGDLSLEAALLSDLINENERLRELLKFKKDFGFNTISAEVVARNPNDWLGSFVINKGTADGVKPDSAVCAARGLLGKVIETDKGTSTVMLITHPGFKTGGLIKDTRVNAVITGGGKNEVRMVYIPLDADVKKGSVVMTSGYSRIFPKGIIIGRIVSIGKSRTGLYKYAVIKPSASSFDQEEVLVID